MEVLIIFGKVPAILKDILGILWRVYGSLRVPQFSEEILVVFEEVLELD